MTSFTSAYRAHTGTRTEYTRTVRSSKWFSQRLVLLRARSIMRIKKRIGFLMTFDGETCECVCVWLISFHHRHWCGMFCSFTLNILANECLVYKYPPFWKIIQILRSCKFLVHENCDCEVFKSIILYIYTMYIQIHICDQLGDST